MYISSIVTVYISFLFLCSYILFAYDWKLKSVHFGNSRTINITKLEEKKKKTPAKTIDTGINRIFDQSKALVSYIFIDVINIKSYENQGGITSSPNTKYIVYWTNLSPIWCVNNKGFKHFWSKMFWIPSPMGYNKP